MTFGGGSAVDPYQLYNVVIGFTGGDYGIGNGFVRDKVQVDPRLVSGENTAVILCIGQSTMANGVDTPLYTPTNAKAENLCLQNGGIYKAADPLVGCDGTAGHWLGRLADKLITAGTFARVILVPVAISGTSAAEWAAGGVANHRLGVATRRVASLGLAFTHVIYMQGETDNAIATTKASYKASVSSTIATLRALGVTCKIAIGKNTWIYGAVSTTIQDAQTELVDNPNGIYAGANTDSLNNTNRYDMTHFNATGANAVANLWQTVIAAL